MNNERESIFTEFQEEENKREITKALTKVRQGRSALFITAIFSLLGFLYTMTLNYPDYTQFGLAVVYIVFFFFSAQRPYTFLLLSSVLVAGFFLVALLTVFTNFSVVAKASGGFFITYIISYSIRITLLIFLVRGTMGAKRWDELANERKQ